MSNHITIELCAEDRARVDRLTRALETRIAQVERILRDEEEPDQVEGQMQIEFDDLQAKLVETLAKAEAPKNATEAAETSTLTTEPPKEEEPTAEEPATAPTAKKVDRADLRAKVIELSAKGLKDQTRDIVKSYAPTVKDVPEDKLAECYAKLEALEG